MAIATSSADLRARYIATAEMIVTDLQKVGAVDPADADVMLRKWVEDYIVADARTLDEFNVPAYLWGERLAPYPPEMKVAVMRKCGVVVK